MLVTARPRASCHGFAHQDELLEYPKIVSKLKKLSVLASDLKTTGFSVQELATGGYTAVQLRDAGRWVLSTQTLKACFRSMLILYAVYIVCGL